MEKRCFTSILLLFLCSLLYLQAQWDTSFSRYWAVRSYLNPAFAGEKEAIRAAALYRYQWSGIENAPRQLLVTADLPFELFSRRHGTGLVAYTETIGDLSNSLLAAQYSFRKETAGGVFNIGLQAGIYNLKFDTGSKYISFDSQQSSRGTLKVNKTSKQVADLCGGISWTGKYVFAGLSAMHINEPRFYARNDSLSSTLTGDSAKSVIPRSYNLTAGCNITLFHPLEIQPMVWVWSDFNTTQVQATLRLEYNKKFSGGASWHINEGYALFAGAAVWEMELGYAYGVHTSGIGRESKGSHEFYLRYNFPLDYFKPKRQPHKSIRLL